MKLTILIFALLFLSINPFAQTNKYEKSVKHEKEAINNYLNKNYAEFLANMKEAEKLRPNHPRLLYNLAAAYCLNNDKNETFSELQKLVNMKLYYPAEKDSDFAACWNEREFKNIINGFSENLMKTGTGTTAFTYPEKDLITESVAYDSVRKRFYLSSIYRRKIVSINENGLTDNFTDEAQDGLWSVFGIKADSKKRILWVCTGAVEQTKGCKKNDIGKTAVFKYDIDSKKLVKKYELGNLVNQHLFGDLVLSQKGDVYVSDSKFNAVYKISADTDSLELFIKSDEFKSLQGLDLSSDEKYLFAADYGQGLYKINLGTKQIEKIKPPLDFTPLGIDGLYFYMKSLIATQNGINPQRVIRIYLNNKLDSIESYKILEANNPYFNEITLGLVLGNDFYFIVNGQWNSFDKGGKIFPLEKLQEPRVLKIKLSGD
jgi:hypothetical protein